MGARYIVIADDFTGANDTGIQFLKAGYKASVLLDASAIPSITGEDVVAVVDTESRNVPAKEAAIRLETVAAHIAPLRGRTIVYKKVDSTLRGNIAAETAVLRDTLHFPVTAFTPAYPKNGRTAKDGLLFLDGVPVVETEMGKDPRNPVGTSSLPETLKGASSLAVRHVSLVEIRSGEIPEILNAEGGKGVYTFDADSDEDLRLIVNGLCSVLPPEEILWVGSAGLAEALTARPRPVLLVAGSMSPKTALQARTLLDRTDVAPVPVDVPALLEDALSEGRRLSGAISSLLRRGTSVLLATSLEEEQIETGRSADASEIVCRTLSEVVSEVLDTAAVSGLFVTGGEVAVRIVRALGATGADLGEELEPGIPLLRLRGGRFHGLPVVTKAGAFGGERTMIECFTVLSQPSVRVSGGSSRIPSF